MKVSRSLGSGNRWTSMIVRSPQITVFPRHVLVLPLYSSGVNVTVTGGDLFIATRAGVDTTVAAIEAHPIHGHVVDGLVIDVNVGDGYVIHAAVVIEGATAPVSAFITVAEISIAVVHAAIKADVRAPISRMPCVETSAPSPITRSPKKSGLGRHHPCSRHPVIANRAVSPVTGSPNVAIARAGRLFINRQRRRRKSYLYEHTGE